MVTTKKCPKCGIEHTREPSRYCSLKCARAREQPPELKEAKKKKLLAYHQTPQGTVTREKASKFAHALNTGKEMPVFVSMDEWAVDIPDIRDIDDIDFLDNYPRNRL
jgi:hypothetical protein